MKIIFATNNQHKINEVRCALPDDFTIITLKEAGINIDIPEPYETLEENAVEKAKIIFSLTNTNCFSEDTGLEVYSINNEPGVHSARYAGEERAFDKNIEKLLFKLKEKENRRARFRAVICLILSGEQYLFEGICEGRIIEFRKGTEGFGYDPVFVPDGSEKTLAEMSMDEKNGFSHRKKAVDKLVAFLSKYHNN